ncbi:MAG: LacI family DNA-binding transcriptional regulator [Eubacteriales bacterium]|nr:LacI family DNA-binding transcriptional regulator [Eubacteriales bacterium]
MTIKDLAAKTGYAVGTVSRALNNHPNVSEKARLAILKAAAESGFELNVNAKQLKQQRSTNILALVKGTGNELFAAMMEQIQTSVAQSPYSLVVDYVDENANEVHRAVQLVREKKPLGILFLGGNQEHFLADFGGIDVPCVLITNDARALPFPNLSSVTTDDREAARRAILALGALGHRRIAVIGGIRQLSDISQKRYEGCLQAFREQGVAFDPARDYQGVRFSYESGYEATQALLHTCRPFSAIFAAADVMAIGAIRALHEAGLRVPEDVSVMGVDGLPLGLFLVPQLATVSQDVRKMARRSVEILLSAIDGGQSVHETVPFQVHLRSSVRKFEK